MLYNLKLIGALLIILFFASGCGGGGGGSGGSSSPASAANWTSSCTSNALNSNNVMVPCSNVTFNTTENGTTGSYSASTYDTDTYGVVSTGNIPTQEIEWYDGDGSGDNLLDQPVSGPTDLPFTHLTDTNAAAAWSSGWTGTGTTINVIDDTNTTIANSRVATYESNALSMRDGNGDTGTYNVSGYLEFQLDHGTLVSNIAGGDKRTVTDYDSYINIDTASITGCVNSLNVSRPTYECPSTSKLTNSFLYNDPSVNISIVQSPGVAKDATITRSNLDLSGYTDPATTWQYLKGFFENSVSYDVVNFSLGAEASSGTSWSDLVALKENFSLNASPSGTYVVAAGNSSAPCTTSNFVNCNIISGMMVLSPYLRNQVIVAGATKDVSGINTISNYSNQAGVMADRYLMAEGDTGYDSSSGDIEGTSFAAPRIAGAAAIVKSKFPNLSGADVASILLLTADKDINDDGVDDFSSVSSTYGRGELDISSALSPVGNLTP